MKKALITGINGQDGSFLAEFLISKGYKVYGLIRRNSQNNLSNLDNLKIAIDSGRLSLHHADLADQSSITRVLELSSPDEIYNLAAMSDVGISFKVPEYTADINAIGVLRLLEAVRKLNLNKKVKIYHASTSELFGKVQEIPQDENTPFYPRSPYGVSKLFAYWITKNYRESYNMMISNGILFNHESERRGENFVTRKITKAVAKIKLGMQDSLTLGNLNAKRDWGYAKDFVEGMWLMLQKEVGEDYVLATGNTHTVREFVETAFKYVGIEIRWEGSGLNERGYNKINSNLLVKVDASFFRPSEVDILVGNPSKAIKELDWNPTKTAFESLVALMVENDLRLLKKL